MLIKKTFQGSIPEKNKIVNTYSESQTDAYGCCYINNYFDFSTEEKVVGTWFGKPLYRKSIIFTDTIQVDIDLIKPHGILNADLVFTDLTNSFMYNTYFECYTIIQTGYNQQFNDKLFIHVNRNNFTIRSNGGWGTNWTKIVTLLYTKTTD